MACLFMLPALVFFVGFVILPMGVGIVTGTVAGAIAAVAQYC